MKRKELLIQCHGKYITLIPNQDKDIALENILEKVKEIKEERMTPFKEEQALEHYRESYRKALKMPDYVSGTKADVCAWDKTVNTKVQKKGKSVVKSEVLGG